MSEFLSNTIKKIRPLDKGAMAEARSRQDMLTKPQGSLGRLEELSIKLAGIHGIYTSNQVQSGYHYGWRPRRGG